MKKNLFYFFIMMAVAGMPLTSCEKDTQKETEQQHNPTSDEDQTPITAFDALSWLQGSLVVVDGNDEVIRRVYGEPLDGSNPDVLSAPVADYAAAEKIFLSWVAPDKEVTRVEGGYDYNLTSADGNAQGSVSFRAAEGDTRIVARMTVAEGTDLKKVREFEFISRDLWPENAAIPKVEAGKIYFYDDYVLLWGDPPLRPKDTATHKHIPFYCIQGNGDGKEGILVWSLLIPMIFMNIQPHISISNSDSVIFPLNPKPRRYSISITTIPNSGTICWMRWRPRDTSGNLPLISSPVPLVIQSS